MLAVCQIQHKCFSGLGEVFRCSPQSFFLRPHMFLLDCPPPSSQRNKNKKKLPQAKMFLLILLSSLRNPPADKARLPTVSSLHAKKLSFFFSGLGQLVRSKFFCLPLPNLCDKSNNLLPCFLVEFFSFSILPRIF